MIEHSTMESASFTPSRRLPAILLAGVLLAAITAAMPAAAQSARTSYGRHFIIPLPDTIGSKLDKFTNGSRSGAWLTFFARERATVTIRRGGFRQTVVVDPARSTTVPLTDPTGGSPFLRDVNRASRNVFDVTSDKPVSATCFFANQFGAEAFSPYPVERWGKEYYAIGLPADFVNDVISTGDEVVQPVPHSAPAQIVIVASQNATTVRIDATAPIGNGSSRTVTLDAGEAYMVRTQLVNRDDGQIRDFSGTHIVADKPVGVLSGNTRSAGSGQERTPFCTVGRDNSTRNTLLEWVPPVEEGGTSFAYCGGIQLTSDIPRTWCSPPGDIIRIYGVAPGTTTVTDEETGARRQVQQGRFIEIRTSNLARGTVRGPFRLTSNKPVVMTQVTAPFSQNQGGREYVINTWGTAMTMMMPNERWLVDAWFRAPDTPRTMSHYLLITAEAGVSISLDGRPVTARPLTSSSTYYTNWLLKVTAGDHRISSTGGRFTAVLYGLTSGYEMFRPARIKKDGGGDVPTTLHPSTYEEVQALSYALPVLGLEVNRADSLEIIPPQFNCGDTISYLTVTNTYSRPIRLERAWTDGDDAFIPDSSMLPRVLAHDSTIRIPISIRRTASGTATAAINVRVADAATRKTIGERSDSLFWQAAEATAQLSMPRTYVAAPGDTVAASIVLEQPLDAAKLSELTLRFDYNGTVIRPALPPTDTLLTSMLAGTLLDGWKPTAKVEPGAFILTLRAPAGRILTGTGILLQPRFATFLGTSDTSNVGLEMRGKGAACIINQTSPGMIQLDICGLQTRLFNLMAYTYALEQNVPDPFVDRTRIDFSIAFEGQTRIEIFDANGALRLVPLDQHLTPGDYSVEIAAESLSPGIYYYRITSGEWTRTLRMVLQH